MKSGEGRRILHASDHVSFTTIPTHQNRTIHIRQCIHNIALRCVSVTNDDHSGRQPRRALIATGTLPFIIIPRLTAIQWLTIPTNNKNDLLESSDSDSVSDLCRTFLQEVFDTLITFPNWNTTTTADWSWPPKCPGFVVGTCLFFWLICGIAQQSSCRLCVSWTGNRSFPAADPAFVRDSTVDCANYPRMSKTKAC